MYSSSSSEQRGSARMDSERPLEDFVRVKMLEDANLKEFWEFATTVRRTRGLAARASQRLRGTWITPELVVQRVHGWSMKAVRLLCIAAMDGDSQARLRKFFQKNRRIFDAEEDPLDSEPRILLKVPYDKSFQGDVIHERRVLADLSGLPGVPELAEQLYFQDIGIHAAAYHFSAAPALQQLLEGSEFVPLEGVHQLLAFMLKTLESAAERGWLHTDLHAKDILLPRDAEDDLNGLQTKLVCGWSKALHVSSSSLSSTPGGLLDLMAQIPATLPKIRPPVRQITAHAPSSSVTRSSESSSLGDDDDDGSSLLNASQAASVCSGYPQVGDVEQSAHLAPSVYSAPEQLISLFFGVPCIAAATDVYRAAAITLMAMCAHGPFGSPGFAIEPRSERSFDVLRRLCFEACVWRSELRPTGVQIGGAEQRKERSPRTEDIQLFTEHLRMLLRKQVNLSKCESPEVQQLLRRFLAAEPAQRPQSAAEALTSLDDAWSALEGRLLAERRQGDASIDDSGSSTRRDLPKPRQRVQLNPPPGLDEMKVL